MKIRTAARLLLLASSFGLALSGCGRTQHVSTSSQAWDPDNDPLLLKGSMRRQLDRLPLRGQLATTPWTDSYWPNNEGGIANRWQTDSNAFKYTPPTRAEVATMNATALAQLSPAEKYDIYMDRYDYPTVQGERRRTAPKDKDWEGICHGWAPAALNFAEPKPTVISSPAGVGLPFGSSDIKALLSYYQGEASDAPSTTLGTRCDIDIIKRPYLLRRHPECAGINAGTFHVVLANLIGLEHKGFIADVDRGPEVWNQPVYAFTSTLGNAGRPSPGAAVDAVSEVPVHTEFTYTEDDQALWAASNGTLAFQKTTAAVDYKIELNAAGEIVGGSWVSKDYPAFIWTQESPAFRGYFAEVERIWQASL